MRAVLVDWLVEVAEEYKLVSDTLYFCVAYIDRFLSLNVLSRHRLQLLGVAAMLIASWVFSFSLSNTWTFFTVLCYLFVNFCFFIVFENRKYEEIKPPEVEDFCYITDNTYSKEEVVIVFRLLLVLLHAFALDSTDFRISFFVKVVNMEADILKALRFELGGPTVKTFLRCFSLLVMWYCVALVYLVLAWRFDSHLMLCCGCRRFCRVGQEGIDVS